MMSIDYQIAKEFQIILIKVGEQMEDPTFLIRIAQKYFDEFNFQRSFSTNAEVKRIFLNVVILFF